MTLDELIESLVGLPASARTATVILRFVDVDEFEVQSIRYEGGEVLVVIEKVDDGE